MLSGARLEITNANTGFTKQITTDSGGYWQESGMSWLTNVAYRIPVQGGDVITVRVLDGCGTGDTCEKSIIAMSGGYQYSAQIDLDITGEISCPPINCPSCSCGGGGSSGSCPTTNCNEAECVDTVCPEATDCPELVTCPDTSDGPVCEEPLDCPDPADEEGFGYFLYVLFVVGGIGIGGFSAYKLKKGEAVIHKKGVGYKVYVGRDGTLKETHKHPGTRGYHDIQNKHRPAQEAHPSGTKTPMYEKDVDGEWMYVE